MVGMETLRCPTCVTVLPDPDARRCPACHAKLRKRRSRPIVLGESNRLSGRSLPVDTELRTRAEERFEPFEPFVSKSKRKSAPVEAVIAFTPSAPDPGPAIITPAAESHIAEPEVVIPDEAVLETVEPEIILDDVPEAPAPEAEPVVIAAVEPEPEPVPIPVRGRADADAPLPQVPLPDRLLIDDDLPDLSVPEPAPVVAAHFLDPKMREATPAPEPVDLTEPEPAPQVIDLNGYGYRDRDEHRNGNANNALDVDDDDAAADAETERPVRPTSKWQAVPTRSASFDGTLNDMVEELHRKAREDVGSAPPR